MVILPEDQLKKLYEKYIAKGWLAVTKIENEFNLKREDVEPAIEKVIKLFKKKKSN